MFLTTRFWCLRWKFKPFPANLLYLLLIYYLGRNPRTTIQTSFCAANPVTFLSPKRGKKRVWTHWDILPGDEHYRVSSCCSRFESSEDPLGSATRHLLLTLHKNRGWAWEARKWETRAIVPDCGRLPHDWLRESPAFLLSFICALEAKSAVRRKQSTRKRSMHPHAWDGKNLL